MVEEQLSPDDTKLAKAIIEPNYPDTLLQNRIDESLDSIINTLKSEFECEVTHIKLDDPSITSSDVLQMIDQAVETSNQTRSVLLIENIKHIMREHTPIIHSLLNSANFYHPETDSLHTGDESNLHVVFTHYETETKHKFNSALNTRLNTIELDYRPAT